MRPPGGCPLVVETLDGRRRFMVVDGPDSPEPLRGAYAPGNTYANACRERSIAIRLRRPGGTDTSRYRGSAATPSTGPVLPQNDPQITRAVVPSSSVTSGMSRAAMS